MYWLLETCIEDDISHLGFYNFNLQYVIICWFGDVAKWIVGGKMFAIWLMMWQGWSIVGRCLKFDVKSNKMVEWTSCNPSCHQLKLIMQRKMNTFTRIKHKSSDFCIQYSAKLRQCLWSMSTFNIINTFNIFNIFNIFSAFNIFSIFIWLVVYLPLWKIWGLVNWDDYSIPNHYGKIIQSCSKPPPTSYIMVYSI